MDELFTSVNHGLAYSSEKLMNLQILQMEIARRSSKIESPSLMDDSIPEEPVQQSVLELNVPEEPVQQSVLELDAPDEPVEQSVLELDVLSGFFYSEMKELDKYMASLKRDMVDLRKRFKSEEVCDESKNALVKAEDSLKELRKILSDTLNQSAMFEDNTIDSLLNTSRSSEGNSPQSSHEGKTVSSKNQKQVIEMLEKSLAREMDLEAKLGEAISSEEELKLKFQNLQREAFFLENSVESLYERAFKGENASDLLLGISKELLGKHSSMQHGNQLRVRSLERQLSESKDEIMSLEGQVSEIKIKAESGVALSVELNETNVKLNNEIERGNMLEKKVKDTETQFEHAKAQLDAVLEQQSMLQDTMSDMDVLIKDLKGKVVKAESRADVAESRLNAMNETNLEMNEELSFLRSKVEMLEGSLSEVNSAKMVTAKNIAIKTKAIANLVNKLAFERERLQLQVSKLTEKNKAMARQLKRNEGFGILDKEASTGDSSTHIHVKDCTVEKVSMKEADSTVPAEEESGTNSNLEYVRDIEPRMSFWTYIFSTILLILVLSLGFFYFMNQNGN